MNRPGPMGHADGRPRIHIWPHANGAAWSIGPTGIRIVQSSPGAALDAAIARSNFNPRDGYVVIGEVL